MSMQNGQVMSSPTVLRTPVPRTSSFSSACPDWPWYLVNGARSGLVTGSLVISLLSLWVATADSSRSPALRPAGIWRRVSRAAKARVPVTVR